ncbi:MAG: hypothetical protein R3240_06000 [Gammaproteobacteria bacterium]|nr:hypothetical protein [Gammaproteobacteria bacterium]
MGLLSKARHVFFVVFLFSATASAHEDHHHVSGDPILTMVDIVMGLKHFPTRAERDQLKDIASHTKDPNIKVIANALIHMRHSVKEEDKAKLEKIIADKSALGDVRKLAEIVSSINHKPSRSDKQELAALSHHHQQ